MNGLGSYYTLALHWGRMFTGKSYWHAEQGPGTNFRPNRLAGYFNDLTRKTNWTGPVDEVGLPLNRDADGHFYYFAITLLQKALGHWDLRQRDENHIKAFVAIADWAVRAQDAQGGWLLQTSLTEHEPSYSAMTLGQAASVLVRAHQLTQEARYMIAAERAVALMLTPVADGGVGRYANEGLVLEKVVLEPSNPILNGWIFALFGLYDYYLATGEDRAREALESTLAALVAHLPRFDAGYWSLYDERGNLASPFYHQLHIAQLQVLALTFDEQREVFNTTWRTFEKQASSPVSKGRALAVKALQKLKNPAKHVLR